MRFTKDLISGILASQDAETGAIRCTFLVCVNPVFSTSFKCVSTSRTGSTGALHDMNITEKC